MRAPKFWTSKAPLSRLTAQLLSPIGAIYGLSVKWRNTSEWRYRSRARVICVGNLSVGGTGKTPVAIEIAHLLQARGLQTFFLSRGYGGRTRGPMHVDPTVHKVRDVGDEPLVLARTAPTVVARNRMAGAEFADMAGADVLVMDDGHQNNSLRKHISFVVIDAQRPYGNGYIVPAGPLREPVRQGLRRATAVILMGKGSPKLPGYRGPILRAQLVPQEIPGIKDKPVIAFAGIGQPKKLLHSLRSLGAQVKELRSFGDHHTYTAKEIAKLKARAQQEGAQLITTEKDFVRLTPKQRHGIRFLPVRAMFENPDAVIALMDRYAIPNRAQKSA
jgi:tetraacyldisaccharide 4'-kinase